VSSPLEILTKIKHSDGARFLEATWALDCSRLWLELRRLVFLWFEERLFVRVSFLLLLCCLPCLPKSVVFPRIWFWRDVKWQNHFRQGEAFFLVKCVQLHQKQDKFWSGSLAIALLLRMPLDIFFIYQSMSWYEFNSSDILYMRLEMSESSTLKWENKGDVANVCIRDRYCCCHMLSLVRWWALRYILTAARYCFLLFYLTFPEKRLKCFLISNVSAGNTLPATYGLSGHGLNRIHIVTVYLPHPSHSCLMSSVFPI
jgi:hypothetical protein